MPGGDAAARAECARRPWSVRDVRVRRHAVGRPPGGSRRADDGWEERDVATGWWIVVGTAVVALVLLAAALGCRVRRGSVPAGAAVALPVALGAAAVLVALACGVFALV